MPSSPTRPIGHHPSIPATLLLLACLLAMLHTGAHAQPVLKAKRVSYLDPVVELYWRVECGGLPVAVSRDRVRIVENDTTEITEAEFSCPDAGERLPASVVLVLDHSGSMTGNGIAGLKLAAHAFVDSMAVGDETAIVWFSTSVTIGTEWTSDRERLHAVIDAVPPMGATTCWDGMYTGVMELRKATARNTRSVIAITDGGDASSTRTPAEIITDARRDHARVATISLGTSTNATELEVIAQLTGGRYFSTPNAGQLASIFLEVQALARRSFDECSAVYPAPIPCPVNLRRTARVTLSDVCGDTLDFSSTYMTALDSTQLTPVRFALGNAVAGPDRVARFPLLTALPFPLDSLPPFSCDISYNSEKLRFIGLAADSVAAIAPGVAVTMDVGNNVLRLTSHVQRALRGDTIALLAADVFGLARNDSTNCTITYAAFHDGCLHAIPSGGNVSLDMELRPQLRTDDTLRVSGRIGKTTVFAVLIRNTGGAPLSVNSFQFQGDADSELQCSTSLPLVIPPRNAAVFSVHFTPVQGGTRAGRMIIGTNSTYEGNFHPVHLVTEAVVATAHAGPILPASVDFGTIAAEMYADTTIRILNPDDAPLWLASVTIAGEFADWFVITRMPAQVLPPLGVDSVSLRVRYPGSACLTARLEIGHDAPGLPPAVCALRANVGWPGRAILRPTYESISLYDVPVGTSAMEGITVRNDGGLPLQLTNWSLSLLDTAVLRFVPPLPSNIEPGQTASVRLRFAPAEQRSYHSDILFSTNDPTRLEGRYYFYGYGSKPVDADPPPAAPSAFRIAGMYPNPVRGELTLTVELARAERLRVAVRDLLGRLLYLQDFGEHAPGFRQLRLTFPALRPGTYVVTASGVDVAHSRLFTLIR